MSEEIKKEKKEEIIEVNYGIRLPMWVSKSYAEKAEGTGEEKWFVEGLAAALGKDRNRPCYELTDECLRLAVKDLSVNSVLFLEHNRDNPIGKIEKAKHIPGKGIWIKAMISKTAPDTWQMIQEGVFTGFSIGGKVLQFIENSAKKFEDIVRQVTRIELMEVSVVALPANIKTRIWNNFVAKSFDLKIVGENGGGDRVSEEIKTQTEEKETAVSAEDKEIEKQLDDASAEKVSETVEVKTEVAVTEEKTEETKVETKVEPEVVAPIETKTEEVEKKVETKVEAKVEPKVEEKIVEKTEEKVEVKKDLEGSDFAKSLQDILASIEEIKKSQISKDSVKEIVKEVLGECLPEEVRKGISLVGDASKVNDGKEIEKDDKRSASQKLYDALKDINKE